MQAKKDLTKILEEARKRFRIETAETAKKEDLINFFKAAYSDQFNASDYHSEKDVLKRWEWANIKNPNIQDKQFPAWFCRDKKIDVIVGHLGIIPVSIRIKNMYYATAWGRGMIVSPEWRRLGAGSLLFDAVMRQIKNNTVFFLLAGLNDYAVSIYKRLGFIHLGYISLYVRIIKLEAILQKRVRNTTMLSFLRILGGILLKIVYLPSWLRRISGGKDVFVAEVSDFDDSFDVLWEKVSPCFSIIAKRDSANLNWRFVNQPFWKYKIFKAINKKDGELKGYVVLREGQSQGLRVGVVSDFFARPDDLKTVTSLISFIIGYFEKKSYVDLIRWDILEKNLERILRKFGFINLRSKSHFMVANIDQNNVDPKFVVNRDNWFINYADCDLDLSERRQAA